MQDASISEIKQGFDRKKEYKSHREFLKVVSKFAKQLVAQGYAESVNCVLILQYEDQGHEDLATLQEWNKRGYSIKKGSKALPIWGKPKPLKKKEAEQKKDKEQEEEENYWPICYLFSSAMVERKQPKP
jgi:hypothetical protein